jgi:hypothetical protein
MGNTELISEIVPSNKIWFNCLESYHIFATKLRNVKWNFSSLKKISVPFQFVGIIFSNGPLQNELRFELEIENNSFQRKSTAERQRRS